MIVLDDEQRVILSNWLDDYIYIKQKSKEYYSYDTNMKNAKDLDLQAALRLRRDIKE